MILIRIMASIVHFLERKVFVKIFCEVLTISSFGIPLYIFETSQEKKNPCIEIHVSFKYVIKCTDVLTL